MIDHHETAERELGDLSYCHFDISRSGAVLAWQGWFTGQEIPELLLYVEDRDMWWWRLPCSRAVAAGLTTYPRDFETWSNMTLPGGMAKLAVDGRAVLRYQEQQVVRLASQAIWVKMSDYLVPVVNTGVLQSEVCEELLISGESSIAAAYYVVMNEEKQLESRWSLRSAVDGPDVSVLAQNWGGGGHEHAAGFSAMGLGPIE